jgi:hypothetical protein
MEINVGKEDSRFGANDLLETAVKRRVCSAGNEMHSASE